MKRRGEKRSVQFLLEVVHHMLFGGDGVSELREELVLMIRLRRRRKLSAALVVQTRASAAAAAAAVSGSWRG